MLTAWSDSGAAGRSETSVAVAADPNYGENTTRPSGSTTPVVVGPAADAGDNRTVKPGDTVTLDGSGSRGNGLRYRWRQISGTAVTLTNGDTVAATFTAPAYSAGSDDELVFDLAVTDSVPRTVSDRVVITVRDPTLSDRAVVIATSMGEIKLELEVEKAPITVANFLQYVDDKFYDNTIFHRVIAGFVIQGGGYTAGMNEKATRDPIENEADNGLSNVRGTIAMARLTDPDTATSQFFINVKNNIKNGDGKSNLDPGGVSTDGYTVFGHVTDGLDVVDRIAAVATGQQSGQQDVPTEDVTIESIRRASP
jgi:cyclophilin family peptidyl-prolyl cis-trans isomerase